MMNERVLVVDDELAIQEFCSDALGALAYEAISVGSAKEALELLREQHFDLLISDVKMPGMTGMELLTRVRELLPYLAVVLITGYGTIEVAIHALRAGARGFVLKPFTADDLRQAIEHALTQARVEQENARLRTLLPLFELTKQSPRSTEANALLSEIVKIAISETRSDGAMLFLADTEGQAGQLRAQEGVLPIPVPDCDALCQVVGNRAQACVLTLQEGASTALTTAMRQAGLGSLLCVPLYAPSRFVGMLALTKAEGQPRFRRGGTEMVSVLGNQMAALLENMRLMEELEAWNRDLEKRVYERTQDLAAAKDDLRRSERLAIIGELGSSVAHELRNPLGVISNSVYYLKNRLSEEDPKVEKHFRLIEREIQICNGIITDLMGLVRIGELQTTRIEPGLLVREIVDRALLPDTIHLSLDLSENLPPVEVDVDRIERAFLNLIGNAVQAMPDGGRLTISTKGENGYVEFSFADTGMGIPSENLPRIFDPLFTTKAKGIGLGLAVVQRMVRYHHGEVSVDSVAREGSRFVVRLPYSEDSDEQEPAP